MRYVLSFIIFFLLIPVIIVEICVNLSIRILTYVLRKLEYVIERGISLIER